MPPCKPLKILLQLKLERQAHAWHAPLSSTSSTRETPSPNAALFMLTAASGKHETTPQLVQTKWG